MLGIGFDSGGTHTSYCLENGLDDLPEPEGNEAPLAISNARGIDTIRDAAEWIEEVVCHVISRHDDDEICAWIGAAGFSAATAEEIAHSFGRPLERLVKYCEQRDRHCEMFIANDAVSILTAPPLRRLGVAGIVGTGSVVLGAHPMCRPGEVVKRGGYEWVVSDEGSGVWMTIECIRMLLKDIQERGPHNYRSTLLERLGEHVGIAPHEIRAISPEYRALAQADLIARRMADTHSHVDMKRFLADFVHPDLFDLAKSGTGTPHDPIAATVLSRSVEIVADNICSVAETLAAYTSDDRNQRQPQNVVVGGNIAANSFYSQQLTARVASNGLVHNVTTIGDAGPAFATLAFEYLASTRKQKMSIVKALDPLHPIRRLL